MSENLPGTPGRTGHILMVGSTTPSHMYPSIGLIRELVRRGHRVDYAVGAALAHLIEPTGARLLTHDSILPIGEQEWSGDAGESMRLFLDEGIAQLPSLIDAYDADPPDVVLYDIGGLAGPVLAHRYGVPAVQLSPAFVAWDTFEEDNAEFYAELAASRSGQAYWRAYDAWLTEHGITVDAKAWLGGPGPILALLPRPLQPFADRVPEKVRFVGPCLDPARLTEDGWTPPADGGPVLLVSFGTSYTNLPEVYRACLRGFADSRWHVVLMIGEHLDPAELGDIPANVEVHRRVPQLVVLAAADAFVTHAGMGGCTEALWFGVPTVAVPQAVDQFANADRLVELGAGVRLDTADVTAESLRSAVDGVAGDVGIAQRLAALRAEIRAHGGIEHAADAVQDVLPDSTVDRSTVDGVGR